AGGLEAPGDGERIIAVGFLLVELALGEAHDAAAAQVDGGIDDHDFLLSVIASPAKPGVAIHERGLPRLPPGRDPRNDRTVKVFTPASPGSFSAAARRPRRNARGETARPRSCRVAPRRRRAGSGHRWPWW